MPGNSQLICFSSSLLDLVVCKIVLPIILPVVCSLIVLKINNRCNRKKESIDKLRERVEDIEADAQEYWGKSYSESNLALARKIKTKLHNFSHYIAQNAKHLKKQKVNLDIALLKFRKEITGGTFESTVQDKDPDKINKIRELTVEMLSFLN